MKYIKSRGVWGHAPPGKFVEFALPETASGGF